MNIIKIIILQFYWLSFCLIGFAILLTIYRRSPTKNFARVLRGASNSQLILFALAMGMVAMLICVVPAYFFNIPFWVLDLCYVSFICGSLVIFYVHKDLYLNLVISRLSKLKLSLPAILCALILLTTYITALLAGGLIDGDAKVFISMINQWLKDGHLSFSDPYFGWNGVINIGYSTNMRFALGAMASHMLQLSAVDMWYYSNGLTFLAIWISFFILAQTFLPGNKHKHWPYIVVGMMPFFSLGTFSNASLPATTAVIWTAIFIVGLKLYLEKGSRTMLLVSILLLITTHSFNASMAAIFLLILSAILLISKSINYIQGAFLVMLSTLLMLPALVAMRFPRYISPDQMSSGWATTRVLGFEVVSLPPFLITTTLISICVLVLFGGIHNFVKNGWLLLLIYFLCGVAFLLVFDYRLLSLIGICYILFIAKNRQSKVLIISLLLFYTLLAFNPFIIKLAKYNLPYWAFPRLINFNLLNYITPLIGYIFLVQFALGKLKYYRKYDAIIIILSILPFLLAAHIAANKLYTPWVAGFGREIQLKQQRNLSTIEKMKPVLQDKVIYSNDSDILTSIPNVVRANFISLPYEGPSPLANRFKRDECGNQLMTNLLENDLASAKIDIVLSNTLSVNTFDLLAKSKPYLKLIYSVDNYNIYEFTTTYKQIKDISFVCSIPKGQ